jgi:hypothetical protein
LTVAANNLVTAAIAYTEAGLPVLPIWNLKPSNAGLVCGCGRRDCSNAGKHPIGHLAVHGAHSATINQQRLRQWWSIHPAANVGIATGDNIIVLDIDPRHCGDRSLAEIERAHEVLPASWRAATGGGGWHIYFAIPPTRRYKNKPLAPGIDVRGYGGLVAAPPSLHQSGRNYAWTHGPDSAALAIVPPWLAALLQPPPPILRPIPIARLSHERLRAKLDGVLRAVATANEGERNNFTYWGACRLAEMAAADTLPHDYAIALIVEAASRTGLSRSEAQRTAQSAFRGVP